MDADHFRDEAEFRSWYARREWPQTLIVHTGRRGEFGVHIYFRGTAATGTWSLDGAGGHIRGDSGYVLGPLSVHDVSGERYEVLDDKPIADAPAVIQTLRKPIRKAEEIADPVAAAHLDWLTAYLEHHGIATRTEPVRITGGWKIGVVCPFGEHSEAATTQARSLRSLADTSALCARMRRVSHGEGIRRRSRKKCTVNAAGTNVNPALSSFCFNEVRQVRQVRRVSRHITATRIEEA